MAPAREAGPLSEYVIASRLRKNRTLHRALLLLRAALFILFLAYRVYSLRSTCSFDDGELAESCRFNGEIGLVALACEVWFFVVFMLSVVTKWSMVERVTYTDRLLKRFEKLPEVDVFVTTADPSKEPPLITMNTILSVLTFDYPTNKLACYVSDDGGSLLTLWSLKETVAFGKSFWHPFCTQFSSHIQPRAPRAYFSRKESAKKAHQYGFSSEWISMKKQYDAFEAKIISMTTAYYKAREETLEILLNELKESSILDCDQQIYSSWALNYNPSNHSSHCEILSEKPQYKLGDVDMPFLVYLSREKRPNKEHHYKAGAMNSLLRVSGIMTNAPFMLNLDCDMYVNESKALLQAMCFFLEDKDKEVNDKIGFVQFPQCFEGVDEDDIYGSSMIAALEVLLKGMDGAQGPPYCGTGCIHKRESLYGRSLYADPCQLIRSSGQRLDDIFGHSTSFILSVQDLLSCTKRNTLSMEDRDVLMRDSKLLIDLDFEEKSSWGKEAGLIYGSVTEDLMSGMKIHGRGWTSVLCMPCPPAFLGCAPSTIEDALTTRRRWSMGIFEILFSYNSPLLLTTLQGLSHAQRLIYIYFYGATLTCLPIFTYSLLPTLSILAKKPIIPKVMDPKILVPMSLYMSMLMSNAYENKVVGVGMKQWWNSETMEYVVAISSSMFALYDVLKKKILGLSETTFTVTPKDQNMKSTLQSNGMDKVDEKESKVAEEAFRVNSELPIIIPPIVVVIFNIFALVIAFWRIIRSPNMVSYWPLTEVACCMWILFMLRPFAKGLTLWVMGHFGPTVLSTSSVLHASVIVGVATFFTLFFPLFSHK